MPSGKKLRRMWTLAITATIVAGCGAEEGDEADINASPTDTVTTSAAPTVPVTTDTGAAAVTPAPGATTPAPGTTPPAGGTAATPAPKGATPPAAAAGGGNAQNGQTLFAGAGLCAACHGPTATGTALAPNLTDATWLNLPANPSVDQIAQLIRTGVPTPRQHPAPMPPMGGAQLNDTQIRDLATYVKSLSGG